jgi:hypothetical protein
MKQDLNRVGENACPRNITPTISNSYAAGAFCPTPAPLGDEFTVQRVLLDDGSVRLILPWSGESILVPFLRPLAELTGNES